MIKRAHPFILEHRGQIGVELELDFFCVCCSHRWVGVWILIHSLALVYGMLDDGSSRSCPDLRLHGAVRSYSTLHQQGVQIGSVSRASAVSQSTVDASASASQNSLESWNKLTVKVN